MLIKVLAHFLYMYVRPLVPEALGVLFCFVSLFSIWSSGWIFSIGLSSHSRTHSSVLFKAPVGLSSEFFF